MALSEQAALLDELMGKNRNAVPGQQTREHDFRDREVCKHYLCGFCPHQLFTNTRADLGPCHLLHDDSLRKSYEQSDQYGRLGYEDSFEVILRRLLNEVEKRIRKGEERLRLTQNDDLSSMMLTNSAEAMLPPNQVRIERLKALNEQINSLIQESEKHGMEGDIDRAKEVLGRIEKLKCERYELETRLPGNDNVKAMEVCTVCGSFLIVGDAQCRVDEHITGKQHLGYAKIREMLETLRKKRSEGVFGSKSAAGLDEDAVTGRRTSSDNYGNNRSGRSRRRSRSPNRYYCSPGGQASDRFGAHGRAARDIDNNNNYQQRHHHHGGYGSTNRRRGRYDDRRYGDRGGDRDDRRSRRYNHNRHRSHDDDSDERRARRSPGPR